MPITILSQENEAFPRSHVILIGIDAGLIAGTIAAVIQQNTLANDYTLKNKINGTTQANYYRLLYEKS